MAYSMEKIKAIFQLTATKSCWLTLRKDLAHHMAATGWKNKTDSGEEAFQALCDWLMRHKFLRPLRKTWKDQKKSGKEISKALKDFICDVGNHDRKAHGAADREWARLKSGPEVELSSSDEDGPPRPLKKRKRASPVAVVAAVTTPTDVRYPIYIHMVHPDLEKPFDPVTLSVYHWWGENNLPIMLGVLREVSMLELMKLATKHIPRDLYPRLFLGATTDAPINRNPRSGTPPYGDPLNVVISDDEELEAWLTLSVTTVRRILVVLHRADRDVQTPPPVGFEYIDPQDYELVEEPAENSNYKNKAPTSTGRTRGWPKTDQSFQRLINKTTFRIERLEAFRTLTATKYLAKVPDAFVPGDEHWVDRVITTPETREEIRAKAAEALREARLAGILPDSDNEGSGNGSNPEDHE